MTIFIVEWSGIECGGAEEVAFDSRDKAEAYIKKRKPEDKWINYEILEVTVQ